MLSVILISLAIFFQMAAAVRAVLLIRHTGWKMSWILMCAAFLLMAVRRLMSLRIFPLHVTADGLFFDILGLIISVLLFLGVHQIAAVFRGMNEARNILLESEERYRSLWTQSLDGIFYFDPQTHEIQHGNSRFCELIGYDPGEIQMLRLEDIVAEAPETIAANVRRVLLEKRVFIGERRYLHKDGSWVYVEVAASEGMLGKRPAVLVNLRDITARRRDQLVLSLTHEVERKILEHEPISSILQFVCQEIAERFSFPLVWIGEKTRTQKLAVRAAAGPSIALFSGVAAQLERRSEQSGPVRKVLRGADSFFCEESAELLGREGAEDEAQNLYALLLPLKVVGNVVGLLCVHHDRREAFGPATVTFLSQLADKVALSLLDALQFERVRLEQAALEASPAAVVIFDPHGIVEWVNPAYCTLTGRPFEAATGQSIDVLELAAAPMGAPVRFWETVRTGGIWKGEGERRSQDGRTYYEEFTVAPVRSEDGQILHYVGIKQDISERRQHLEQIRHMAFHDPLTNLHNRQYAEEYLVRVVARARRGAPSTLFLLDVDNFKVVNDTLGHGAGNLVLQELGRLITADLRPSDEVARLGDDEFLVILEGIPADVGRLTAQRLCQRVDSYQFSPSGSPLELSVSVGVVPIDGTLDVAGILALADSALGNAKQSGRNRVVLFGPGGSQLTSISQFGRFAAMTKEALRSGKLVLFFQPIIHIESGHVAHYEALVRLPDPQGTGEMISPALFLPAAERFGMLPRLDTWVVESVLGILAQRQDLRIFVNLSGASLGQEALLNEIAEKVRRSGILPGQLGFEITEQTAVGDLALAQAWMRGLREAGCFFALDDFGIGFSSFGYLQNLPADYVKIDGSFVRGLENNSSNRSLVKAIVNVAHSLGKETIGEMVESLPALAALRELHVEYAQGYAIGRPLPEIPMDPRFAREV